MKKILGIMSAVTLTFVLAACNQTAEPTSTTQEKKSTKESELTLQEVFEKSNSVMSEVSSFRSIMKMNQVMTMPGSAEEAGNLEMQSNIDSAIIMEPMTLHQNMTMSMVAGEESVPMQDMNMESYLTDEGFFMKESVQNKWVKMPKELSDQILQTSNAQTNPSQQLESLEPFKDDFEFQQDENYYILKLNASGEKFNELIQNTIKETMPDMLQQADGLENIGFDQVEYELFIDKETFYTMKLNSTMKMTLESPEGNIETNTKLESKFKDYNQVEAITVPQEVVDTAEEIAL